MSFDFCVYLECSEEVMKERLLGRSKTSGRADDNEETIMKRFQTFQTETAPVTEFFMTASKLYAVSAEQSPEEVFEEAVKKIGVKLDEKVGTPQTDAVSAHAGEADPAETNAAASTVVNESPNPEAAPKESQAAEVAAP
jgi:broad-specificity NMP kinase